MVYISRKSWYPSERHSPGSDGFWISLIALSIIYLSSNGEKIKYSVIKFKNFKKYGLTAIITTIGLLSASRSLYAFEKQATSEDPTYFPKSCIEATRAHPLLRNDKFKKCFVFADERSTYQLSLMEMGGMSGKNLERPIYDNYKAKVIAILPSRLMAAFSDSS
jgi:hypothetical protein